ncbi:hypothetical protein BS642_04420 [Chromobacterium violaceum]|nr:hypothetical protein BS642_04420 [Chromobacterium violaceum]
MRAPGCTPAQSGALPAGIPAEMLERRPDIQAPRPRFQAAFYGEEAARRARRGAAAAPTLRPDSQHKPGTAL